MPRHIWHPMPCHTIPCHVTPCHPMPSHSIPCHTMPCHAMLCRTMRYHTITYYTMPCHTVSCHTITYHTIPYHTIPYHTIPYNAMPCNAMPCHQGRNWSVNGGGGGVNIHIFAFCPTIFFGISGHYSWFQKKFVGQNANIWICTPPINALATALHAMPETHWQYFMLMRLSRYIGFALYLFWIPSNSSVKRASYIAK